MRCVVVTEFLGKAAIWVSRHGCVLQDPELVYQQLTIDRLNVAASAAMYHRFDNFNDSYSPMASPNLRAIFMKTHNKIGGEYFAQLLHKVFSRLR